MGKTWFLFSSKSQTREEAGEKTNTVTMTVTALCTKCCECLPGVLLKENFGVAYPRMSSSTERHGIVKDMPGAQCALQGLRSQRGTDFEAPLSMLTSQKLSL